MQLSVTKLLKKNKKISRKPWIFKIFPPVKPYLSGLDAIILKIFRKESWKPFVR